MSADFADCKPGTVAIATVRGVPNVRIARVDYPTTPPWMSLDVHPNGCVWHSSDMVNDVRPLVALGNADIRAARAALAELAELWEAEAQNYRIAEPVHFRHLAENAVRHARQLRAIAAALAGDGAA